MKKLILVLSFLSISSVYAQANKHSVFVRVNMNELYIDDDIVAAQKLQDRLEDLLLKLDCKPQTHIDTEVIQPRDRSAYSYYYVRASGYCTKLHKIEVTSDSDDKSILGWPHIIADTLFR